MQNHQKPHIKVAVPEDQKRALMQAIMTLITVLVGIGLTLTTQVITQGLNITEPEDPVISDALQPLGISHFDSLVINDDIVVGDAVTITGALAAGSLTVDDTVFEVSDPLTLTETITNVTLLYLQN